MVVGIIGGSGFIGSRFSQHLEDNGVPFVILDKNPSLKFPHQHIECDVRDQIRLADSLMKVDIIVNLAAEHRDDVTPTSLYYDVNVQGAKNVVSAAVANNVKKIVFTSSVAVYGLNKPNPDETCSTEPFNHYGKSKLKAEQVYLDWVNEGDGRSLIIVRPVVIFGEGNRGNVYNLIKQIQHNHFIMVGLGNNRKSMAYVGNVAEFLFRAIESGPGLHLYNFADKPDMQVNDLIELIRSELGIRSRLPNLPYAVGYAGGLFFDGLAKLTGKKFPISSIRIRKFCANTTVSTKTLDASGFKSPYTLQEGIRRMIANLDQNIYFEGGG
jgi:GlcNAc-P-P-Und epimerase